MEDEIMNKIIVFISAVILFFASCRENETMDYELAGKVYFYERTMFANVEQIVSEKNYSFALQNSSLMKDTFLIKVKLMGYIGDADRIFRAAAVEENTTAIEGIHYTLFDGVMSAGEYISYLPIVLYRTEDTKTKSVSLKLQLVETEDLTPGNSEFINFSLTWGDILLRPDHWPDYYFGVYSVNKYRFAIDVLGLTDWPQAERSPSGPQEGIYTIVEIQAFAIRLNDAYREYREKYGPIYVDDDAEQKEEIYYGPR
jgi:hypothetical protein